MPGEEQGPGLHVCSGEMEPAWKVKPGQMEVLLISQEAEVSKALFSL